MATTCNNNHTTQIHNKMSARTRQKEMLSIAHTAQCKLHLEADRPDRNLRFILGHAFTLDKLRLRIAEIEEDEDEEQYTPPTMGKERRISFRGQSPRPTVRRASPPPSTSLSDTDSDEELDEEDDAGLSLQRFSSAAAVPPRLVKDNAAEPPRLVEDDSSSEDDEDEPKSPPGISEVELQEIKGGEVDEELQGIYNSVAGCPCHGVSDAAGVQVWEIPKKLGQEGGRRALVQVAA